MSLIVEAGVFGNIFECAGTVVFKEDIAPAQDGHVEVWIAVVVDIGERGRYPNRFGRHTRPLGNILKFAASQISPQFVVANLGDEIDIVEAIPIHVGNGYPIAVVVVIRPVVLARIGSDPVAEADSTVFELVGEGKVAKYIELGLKLSLSATFQPWRIDDLLGKRQLEWIGLPGGSRRLVIAIGGGPIAGCDKQRSDGREDG